MSGCSWMLDAGLVSHLHGYGSGRIALRKQAPLHKWLVWSISTSDGGERLISGKSLYSHKNQGCLILISASKCDILLNRQLKAIPSAISLGIRFLRRVLEIILRFHVIMNISYRNLPGVASVRTDTSIPPMNSICPDPGSQQRPRIDTGFAFCQ